MRIESRKMACCFGCCFGCCQDKSWELALKSVYGNAGVYHIMPNFTMGRDFELGSYGSRGEIASGLARGNVYSDQAKMPPPPRDASPKLTIDLALQGGRNVSTSLDFKVTNVADGKVGLQAGRKDVLLVKLVLANVREWDLTGDLADVEMLLNSDLERYKNRFFVLHLIRADIEEFSVRRLRSGSADIDLGAHLPKVPLVGDVLRFGDGGELGFDHLRGSRSEMKLGPVSDVLLASRRFQFRAPRLIRRRLGRIVERDLTVGPKPWKPWRLEEVKPSGKLQA